MSSQISTEHNRSLFPTSQCLGPQLGNSNTGAGIKWRLICSHVWQLMPAVGWSYWPEHVCVASSCTLGCLITWWWVSRASRPEQKEWGPGWVLFYGLAPEVMQHHFHCILSTDAVTKLCPIQGERKTTPPLNGRVIKLWRVNGTGYVAVAIFGNYNMLYSDICLSVTLVPHLQLPPHLHRALRMVQCWYMCLKFTWIL